MKNKTVLVCVTAQKSSKFLIKSGKMIADEHGAKLEVISVLPADNAANTDTIEKLYEMTLELGADMQVYFNDEPMLTVAAHISTHKPELLVAGFPAQNSNDFVSMIHSLIPELPISMVEKDGTIYNMLPMELNQFLQKA